MLAYWRQSTLGKKVTLSGSSIPSSWKGNYDHYHFLQSLTGFTSIMLQRLQCNPNFNRYCVLLTVRTLEDSDREQTLALLDMVDADEGQYQLGLTKVILLLSSFIFAGPNVNVCLWPGVPQRGLVSAARGKVEQYPDLGCHHHPKKHQGISLQEELQVLQTKGHNHPESYQRTPDQVQTNCREHS